MLLGEVRTSIHVRELARYEHVRCAVAPVECLPAGGENFPLPSRCRLEVHVHCRYVTQQASNNSKSALQRNHSVVHRWNRCIIILSLATSLLFSLRFMYPSTCPSCFTPTPPSPYPHCGPLPHTQNRLPVLCPHTAQ
jgi:hypothetical protein